MPPKSPSKKSKTHPAAKGQGQGSSRGSITRWLFFLLSIASAVAAAWYINTFGNPLGVEVAAPEDDTPSMSFYGLAELGVPILDIDRQPVDFNALKGKVLLVINVASRCGLTQRNYEDIAVLQERYADRGLLVVAFPCNQFGEQEPGTNEEIKQFAADVGFRGLLMDKVRVNGEGSSPAYDFMKLASNDASPISWNFAKFVINKRGEVVSRHAPTVTPLELEPEIQRLLAEE